MVAEQCVDRYRGEGAARRAELARLTGWENAAPPS